MINQPLTTPQQVIIGTNSRKRSKQTIDYLFSKFLRDDDYKAYEQLFLLTYNPLRVFCKRIVQVNEIAEELVSEVFFKIWNNRKTINITSSPKAYLYTAVQNISLDHLRKEKKYSFTTLENLSAIPCNFPDPQRGCEVEEFQVKVDAAIEKLPKQCRLIFQMSRDQGLRYNEIAEKLHLSVKTIETQMGRALKSLRKSIS